MLKNHTLVKIFIRLNTYYEPNRAAQIAGRRSMKMMSSSEFRLFKKNNNSK